MAFYENNYRQGSENGPAIVGAKVTVNDSAGNLALLTDENGVEIDNPLTTDSQGAFSFYAPDGYYTFVLAVNGAIVRTDANQKVGSPDDTNQRAVLVAVGENAVTLPLVPPALRYLARLPDGSIQYQASQAVNIADALGTATDMAPSQRAVQGFIDDLAADTGASQVGIGTSGLTGIRSADFYFKSRGVILSADTRVDSTGTNDSAAGAQAAITASGSDAVYVPKGNFKISSALSLSQDLVLEGMGPDSKLMVGSSNQVLLNAITTGRVRLFNIRLVGDKTTSASSNGIGLKFGNLRRLELDTVTFENFGFGGLRGDATATAVGTGYIVGLIFHPVTLISGAWAVGQEIYSSEFLTPGSGANAGRLVEGGVLHPSRIILDNGDGTYTLDRTQTVASSGSPVSIYAIQSGQSVTLRNVHCFGGANPSGGENADFYFAGPWRDVTIENFRIDPDRSSPMGNGIVFTQNADGQGWDRVQIRGGRIFNVGKRGIALGSEVTTGATSGRAQISDVQAYNCGFEAFKSKNVRWLQLSNCHGEGCEPTTTEQGAQGLQGTFLFNSSETVEVVNCTVKNGGTDGFRIRGFDPNNVGGNPTNINRARWSFTNCIVEGAGQSCFYVDTSATEIHFANCHGFFGANGIRSNFATSRTSSNGIHLTNCSFKGNSAFGALFLGASATPIGEVTLTGCRITDNGSDGLSGQFVSSIKVVGCDITDNNRGAAFSNTGGIIFTDNRVKPVDVSVRTQGAPIAVSGADVVIITGNDFVGSGASPTYNAPTTAATVRNNKGWLTGANTQDLPSIASGAVGTAFSITVVGAAAGDIATVSCSIDTQGIQFDTRCLTNSVSVYPRNPTGAAIDLASATFTAQVEKLL